MYPDESHTHKSNSTLVETVLAAEKNKTKNPPGVSMPSEKEMSLPQLG